MQHTHTHNSILCVIPRSDTSIPDCEALPQSNDKCAQAGQRNKVLDQQKDHPPAQSFEDTTHPVLISRVKLLPIRKYPVLHCKNRTYPEFPTA